jgi:hypothetical protein
MYTRDTGILLDALQTRVTAGIRNSEAPPRILAILPGRDEGREDRKGTGRAPEGNREKGQRDLSFRSKAFRPAESSGDLSRRFHGETERRGCRWSAGFLPATLIRFHLGY